MKTIFINFKVKLKNQLAVFMLAVVVSTPALSSLKLTENEKKWIKENPVVKFTGDPNWLPYEAFQKDGEYIGIVSEHLKLIEQLTGLKFDAVPVSSWTESLKIATEGKVSVISGDAADVILNKRFKPIDTYSQNKIVIIMSEQQQYVNDVEDIKDKKIAIIKDYGYTADIFKYYPGIKFIEVENIQEGLEGVASNNFDAMLATFALATYTISDMGLHNVKVVGMTKVVMDLTLFIDKNKPVLHSIINKSLKSISLAESNKISQKWIKQHYVEKMDYSLVLQVVGVALVIIIAIVVWNRTLSHEIKLRRKTEDELQKLKETLDQTLDCVFIFSADNLLFTYVNEGAVRQVGYDKDVLYKMHPYDIIPMVSKAEFNKIIGPLLSGELDSLGFETTHQHKNGEHIQVEIFLQYIKDNNNLIAIVRDVTERQHVDAILRSLASGDSKHDFSGFVNDVLARLTHLYDCKYAFVGELQDDNEHVKTLAVRVGDKSAENFVYHLGGTPCQDVLNFDAELIPKNVQSLYPDDDMLVDMGVESYYGAPLISAEGELMGILAVMNTEEMKLDDWTEPVLGIFAKRVSLELEREKISLKLKHNQDALEEKVKIRTADLVAARNEAERANHAKSEFLSSMSHELRTPLNAILGFAQMLELDHSGFSEIQHENISEILTAGEHLLNLINQVLNLSHIESGKLDLTISEVDLAKVTSECLKLINNSVKERNLKVINNISEHNYVIKADFLRVKQVILNLVSNAVKYNTLSGCITIDSDIVSERHIRMSVSDTGKGLSGDEISRLFNPFERLNTEQNIEGTGIGLTITKHLCELMGGDIGVESSKGAGSKFWVEFELAV